MPIAEDEEKAFLKVLKNWRETVVTKDQQSKINLKGQDYWNAAEKLPKEEYEILNKFRYLSQVVDELEKRNSGSIEITEINESSVDREKSRKVADVFIENLINNRRNYLKLVLDSTYYELFGSGNERLDYTLDTDTKTYGNLTKCKYKYDKINSDRYDSDGKRAIRRFWYGCENDKKKREGFGIQIQISSNLRVLDFNYGMFDWSIFKN